MTYCFIQQIVKTNVSHGVENCTKFRGRGGRREASDDQKKEANARSNYQPRSSSIPHHTKTTTPLGGGSMTYTSCRDSKPKTCGQTKTTVGGLGCSIGSTTYTSRYTTRTPNGEIYISIKKSK
jgi:hypothetical protein